MSLTPTTRLVSARFLLVCFAVGLVLLFGFRSHLESWRARGGSNALSGSATAFGNDPQQLMAKADHFYWLNNGPRAAQLYEKAEQLFAARGDTRNEIHAKVGHLRSDAETMSFVELSGVLEQELHNPIVERDRALQLWCLIAKGYTDIEIDYRASKRDCQQGTRNREGTRGKRLGQ